MVKKSKKLTFQKFKKLLIFDSSGKGGGAAFAGPNKL